MFCVRIDKQNQLSSVYIEELSQTPAARKVNRKSFVSRCQTWSPCQPDQTGPYRHWSGYWSRYWSVVTSTGGARLVKTGPLSYQQGADWSRPVSRSHQRRDIGVVNEVFREAGSLRGVGRPQGPPPLQGAPLASLPRYDVGQVHHGAVGGVRLQPLSTNHIPARKDGSVRSCSS